MIRPVVGKSFDHSGVPQHATRNIRMYPNPTTGIVHIDTDMEEDVDYRITNVFGQCVETGKLYTKELSLERFPTGIYFIQLSADNQTIVTEKIIKH
jgi:hypothetical protein